MGAILVQNTAWKNADRAVAGLRTGGMLSLECLRKASAAEIEQAVRPAGFYRQKALTIRTFLAWLDRECEGQFRSCAPLRAAAVTLLVDLGCWVLVDELTCF